MTATDFPPDQFVCEPAVPIIDEHEGARTHKGSPLRVDAEMLERIAKNQNDIYRSRKCPVFIGLGHTKDGEEFSETDQPPIVGYATNLRVEPFLKTGKKALYADLHFKREHRSVIRDYPGRSVELYPGSEEIPFLALLRKVPERNLPVIKFNREPDRDRYSYIFPTPAPTTLLDSQPLYYSRDRLMDTNPAVTEAQFGETKSVKAIEARLEGLEKMIKEFVGLFQQAMQDEPEPDGDDLLAPAGDGDDEKGGDTEKPAKKEPPEPEKVKAEEPVKMNASQPSATNVNIPCDEKEKVKMSRDNAELLKFQREAAAKQASADAKIKELTLKFNRTKAEKTIADWETKDHILFPSDAARAAEIELMADLDDESFVEHEKRAKLLYARKTPAGDAVREVSKFARVPEVAGEKTMDDVQKEAEAAISSGLSYKEYISKKGKK